MTSEARRVAAIGLIAVGWLCLWGVAALPPRIVPTSVWGVLLYPVLLFPFGALFHFAHFLSRQQSPTMTQVLWILLGTIVIGLGGWTLEDANASGVFADFVLATSTLAFMALVGGLTFLFLGVLVVLLYPSLQFALRQLGFEGELHPISLAAAVVSGIPGYVVAPFVVVGWAVSEPMQRYAEDIPEAWPLRATGLAIMLGLIVGAPALAALVERLREASGSDRFRSLRSRNIPEHLIYIRHLLMHEEIVPTLTDAVVVAQQIVFVEFVSGFLVAQLVGTDVYHHASLGALLERALGTSLLSQASANPAVLVLLTTLGISGVLVLLWVLRNALANILSPETNRSVDRPKSVPPFVEPERSIPLNEQGRKSHGLSVPITRETRSGDMVEITVTPPEAVVVVGDSVHMNRLMPDCSRTEQGTVRLHEGTVVLSDAFHWEPSRESMEEFLRVAGWLSTNREGVWMDLKTALRERGVTQDSSASHANLVLAKVVLKENQSRYPRPFVLQDVLDERNLAELVAVVAPQRQKAAILIARSWKSRIPSNYPDLSQGLKNLADAVREIQPTLYFITGKSEKAFRPEHRWRDVGIRLPFFSWDHRNEYPRRRASAPRHSSLYELQDLRVTLESGRELYPCRLEGGASLGVSKGETVALVGPSGSGKSVLLRVLANRPPGAVKVQATVRMGQQEPSAYGGAEAARQRERLDRKMAFVPQEPAHALVRYKTLRAHAMEVAAAWAQDAGNPLNADQLLVDAMRKVGLNPSRRDQSCGAMNRGAQQAACLALVEVQRKLAGGLDLLLLDEPFSSVDTRVAKLFIAYLDELRETERELTIVLTAHDPEIIQRVLRPEDRVIDLGPMSNKEKPLVRSDELLKIGALSVTKDDYFAMVNRAEDLNLSLTLAEPESSEDRTQSRKVYAEQGRISIDYLYREHRPSDGSPGRAVVAENLNLEGGNWYAVRGENGIGKSTLLMGLALQEGTVAEGKIVCGKREIPVFSTPQEPGPRWRTHRTSVPRVLQLVTQYPNLAHTKTLSMKSLVRETLSRSALGSANTFDTLWDMCSGWMGGIHEDQPAGSLSGGQAARVQLLLALTALLDEEPRGQHEVLPVKGFLLLDETLTHLDPRLAGEVAEMLDRLRMQRGLGIIMISHSEVLVKRFCNRALEVKRSDKCPQLAVVEAGQRVHHDTP